MPINPNIALQVQPAKINTPFENLDVVMQARQRESVAQDAERKARAAQRAEQEAAAVRGILEQTGGDWDQALPQIRRVAPAASLEIEKQLGEARTKAIDAASKTLALERDLTSKYVRRLQAVPDGDDELYQFVRGQMARELPDEAAMLPETYDKSALQRFSLIGLDADKVYQRDQDALKLVLEGKWREAAGTSLSVATDAEDWNERIQGLRGLGMPASEIAQFGSYSPENVQRAAALSMTPEKRATLAGQAEGREIQREGQRITMRGQDLSAATAAAGRAVTMRGQDLVNARAKEAAAAGGGGPLTADDEQLIKAILANPALFDTLTPSAKTKILGPLAARGFKPSPASAKGGPNVGAIMGEIETLSKRINTSDAGPLSTLQGAMRGLASRANMDNDVAEYEALIQGMIPMVARANGHSGVLTQQDVDSTRRLFPEVNDNKTLARNKMDRIKRLLAGAGGAAAPNQTPIGGQTGIEVVVNGRAFVFPTQAAADAFKAKAGIR